MEQEKLIKTTMYFPETLLKQLDDKSKQEHRKRSDTVRMLVEEYINKK